MPHVEAILHRDTGLPRARDVRLSIVAVVLMLLSVLAAYLLTPTMLLSARLDDFSLEARVPKSFDGWTVDERTVPVLISPDTQRNLDTTYDKTLGRTYIHQDGRRVMLSIAYGSAQTRQLRAHRQEVCYSSQGFKITNLHDADFRLKNNY